MTWHDVALSGVCVCSSPPNPGLLPYTRSLPTFPTTLPRMIKELINGWWNRMERERNSEKRKGNNRILEFLTRGWRDSMFKSILDKYTDSGKIQEGGGAMKVVAERCFVMLLVSISPFFHQNTEEWRKMPCTESLCQSTSFKMVNSKWQQLTVHFGRVREVRSHWVPR